MVQLRKSFTWSKKNWTLWQSTGRSELCNSLALTSGLYLVYSTKTVWGYPQSCWLNYCEAGRQAFKAKAQIKQREDNDELQLQRESEAPSWSGQSHSLFFRLMLCHEFQSVLYARTFTLICSALSHLKYFLQHLSNQLHWLTFGVELRQDHFLMSNFCFVANIAVRDILAQYARLNPLLSICHFSPGFLD